MAQFKGIPKRLLIHTVEYIPPKDIGDGSIGGGSSSDPVEVKNVRFMDKVQRVSSTTNSEVLTSGVVFFDAMSTSPFFKPDEDGQIIFDGKTLKIVSVLSAYTTGETPHHYEVNVL